MKPDEQQLWNAVVAGERPRTAGLDLGMHSRRVVYLCNKWSRLGIYEYGVGPDLGWTTGRPDPRIAKSAD